MGKIKQGILGGFNGTTGSVVGASWKGIAYMRGKAQSIKNPRTELQQSNRGLFGAISDLMSKALVAVNFGYRGVAVKKSSFNVAVQENFKAMVADAPDIMYNSLQFSKGSITPVIAGEITESDGVLSAGFSVVGTQSGSRSFCGVAVFTGEFPSAPYVSVVTTILSSGQSSGHLLLPIPQGLEYNSAQVYVFEYRDEDKAASLTTYVGSYTPA